MKKLLSKLGQDNKGLSLVELIVSFAVLGFVTVALMAFMSSSMRFFRNNTVYIGLQYEYQSVMTMLREYIVDSNAGIVADDTENAIYIVYSEYLPDDPSTAAVDDPAILFTTHLFFFDDGVLYYQWAENYDNLDPAVTDTDGPPFISPNTTLASVVSDRVTAFEPLVILSDYTNRATVRTDISFLSVIRSYNATQEVATRNRVVVAADTTPPVKYTEYLGPDGLREALIP